nr:phosphatidate cytidylyltransferase [candidate division Zixibacteria bacterium]
MNRNLLTRIIVALIFGPLIILISYLGGFWLLGMILIFALIGIVEYMLGCSVGPGAITFWLTMVFIEAAIISSTLYNYEYSVYILIVYFLITGIILAVQNREPVILFQNHANLIWGVVYLGGLYPFVYHVRYVSPDKGGDWLLFLFGTLWLSDTLAMFIGKALGKRKLAPTVSPNKTVSGFVGGLSGGLIVALIMYFWRLPEIPIFQLCLAGVLISMIGQLGDLVESCWKRAVGIKDSSAIIPGHGGILDRFDSLLFAAPALYFTLKYFIYK